MEAAPPSYETATLVDFWDIVARYVPSSDLCSAALVCSRWHATFTPHIWGNPASHFGIENDAVYVALTRFKRTLQTARLLVRSLTHTLHFPPAHAEIYNGPHADWLREVIERLPNLQSLIVRGLPFFDFAALQALHLFRKKSDDRWTPPSGVVELPGSSSRLSPSPITPIPSFGLRLLDASRCSNVTSNGLASALGRFEGLMYLDLSFTYPARDPSVLATLRKLPGLQVLKLRGVSLKDESIEALGKAVRLRVRSLDIRDNQITDRGVRLLLEHCFITDGSSAVNSRLLQSGQRSPTLLLYLGSEMLEIYQGEGFEGYLRNAFTGRFVSRLAIEDAPAGGITHLYIAGNALTVEGVSGLVRSGRLHVLDVGGVAPAKVPHSSASEQNERSDIDLPGIEKLTPVFAKHAADAMTFVRIDHSLITKRAHRLNANAVVQGRAELWDTSLPPLPARAAELGSSSFRPEAFELPTDPQTPRYELEADPIKFAITPATDDTYKISVPEHNAGETSPNMTAAGLSGLVLPQLATSPAVSPPQTPRPRSYSSMATERKARLDAHILTSATIHPAMLPHLSTLVLTDVPNFSSDRTVADYIIGFIRNCAEEASFAATQAKLDYSAPPGRKGHVSALRHSANKLFALKRLVLEMAPENVRRSTRSSPWQYQETKSITEDRDSEALWTAASTDFSFFGDEENMFPTLETDRISYSGEKEVSFGQPVRNEAYPNAPARVDNIGLISSFRRERRLAHQRNLATGNRDVETEGLWDGIVQVVRSNNTIGGDEEMDYYGNKFTNNYLYR